MYKVVTVASKSPKNYALCRSFGANCVFDVSWTPPFFRQSWRDRVGSASVQGLEACDHPSAPMQLKPSVHAPCMLCRCQTFLFQFQHNDDVRQLPCSAQRSGVKSIWADSGLRLLKIMRAWLIPSTSRLDLIASLVGGIKPNRVKLFEGDLPAIPEGSQYIKASGERNCYRIVWLHHETLRV